VKNRGKLKERYIKRQNEQKERDEESKQHM
jgi:hypothetical protein